MFFFVQKQQINYYRDHLYIFIQMRNIEIAHIKMNLSLITLMYLCIDVLGYSQSCGKIQQCPVNTYCLLDPLQNISVCSLQIGETPIKYRVNSSVTYLTFKPSMSRFERIYFYFRGEKLNGVENILRYVVESEDETAYINLNSSMVYRFNATDQLREFYMQDTYFKQKSNGQYANIIFAISLSLEQFNQTMQTYVVTSNANYYLPLIFGVFGILSILSFLLILVVMRKKYLRRQHFRVNRFQKKKEIMEKYLPKRKYSNNESSPQDCSICLIDISDGDEVRSTPCGHTYHTSCFDEWYFKNPKCPVCRESLELVNLISKIHQNEIKRIITSSLESSRQVLETNIRNSLLEQQSSILKETEMIIPHVNFNQDR